MADAEKSWAARVLGFVRTGALLLVVLAATLAVAAVVSGRYQARPVLSGSMRPGLPVGGVVVSKQVPVATLKVRDVIVFHRPDNPAELVVHRIISLHRAADGVVIQTRGDDNPVKDPWRVTLRGTTAYRAQFSVPLLGYLSVWWHQPLTRTVVLALAACCAVGALLALMVPSWFRRHRPAPEHAERGAATSRNDGSHRHRRPLGPRLQPERPSADAERPGASDVAETAPR